MEASSDSFFKLQIMKIVSTLFSYEHNNTLHVSAEEGRKYMLRQPKKLFSTLFTREPVKRWLEDQYRDKCKIYFVIGYRTLVDSKLSQEVEHQGKTTLELCAQVGAMAGIDLTGLLNVNVAPSHATSTSGGSGFEPTGERIYAVCYRRVGFKWFKGVEGAYLKSSDEWRTFAKSRGKSSSEKEIVQVNIDGEIYEESEVAQKRSFPTEEGELSETFVELLLLCRVPNNGQISNS
ncbi:unnamed protein product [Calypogeia fissa]